MESLVDRALGVEGESSINLCGNLSRNDVQDLLSELDEKTIESCINLVINVLAVLFSVCDSDVHQLCVLWLLRRSKDEGWVGGSILWLVLSDGWCSQYMQLIVEVDGAYKRNLQSQRRRPENCQLTFRKALKSSRTVPAALSCSREFDMMQLCGL